MYRINGLKQAYLRGDASKVGLQGISIVYRRPCYYGSMRVALTLASVAYSGWSIGRDIRIEIVAGEVVNVWSKRMRPLSLVRTDFGLGVFDVDAASSRLPLCIVVTEKDQVYSDISTLQKDLIIGEMDTLQSFTCVVEVTERRFVFWKVKAIFTLQIEARQVALKEPDIRKYISYNGEDYNRYDKVIRKEVMNWNRDFSADTDPPPDLLDPNLVKAICYQESRVGNDPRKNGSIDIMQVGYPEDPALRTLRGELPEFWLHHGQIVQLQYPAGIASPEESVRWGVRWLYHKAQYIRSDGRRAWRTWKDAVHRYGPGTGAYTDNVWSIYEQGLDARNGERRLWSIFPFLALLFFPLIPAIPSPVVYDADILRSYDTHFYRAPEPYRATLVVHHHPRENVFFVEEKNDDWWETVTVGRVNGDRIEWLSIPWDEREIGPGVLSARWLDLQGIADPVLEVYEVSHRGTGSLRLFRADAHALVPLLTAPAVDTDNEDVWRPGGYPEYGGYASCGNVYSGGKLDALYRDENNDGVDDVILSGTVLVVCANPDGDSPRDFVVVQERISKMQFILKIEP